MTDQELKQYCGAVTVPDREIMDAARRRQAELAKPPGSLGKLEDYSIRLAGITGQVRPHIEKFRVLVLAADNGVTAEGISSAPTSVTLSQVINMTRHKTGMSALAHYFGNEVVVADMGIDTDRPIPGVLDRKVRRSTGNIAREPAMTRQQALQALETGMELATQAAADGVQAAVGGLDLAAMTGAFLGCAQNHVPAVVDGYISIVAALTAVRLCPAAGEYLFLSHASYEIGYRIAAQELGQEPCLLLGMRLGEGSGCPVMFQILRAACAVMDGMATFPEAAIEDDYLAPIRAQDSFTVTP